MAHYESNLFHLTGTRSYTYNQEGVSRNITHILVLNPLLRLAGYYDVIRMVSDWLIRRNECDVCT